MNINNKSTLSKLFAILIVLSMVLTIVPIGVIMADDDNDDEYGMSGIDLSANPDAFVLNNATRITISFEDVLYIYEDDEKEYLIRGSGVYEDDEEDDREYNIKDITLTIELANNINVVTGSFTRTPSINGRILTWNLGNTLPTDDISFDVKPSVIGRDISINTIRSNVSFTLEEYDDDDGSDDDDDKDEDSFTFPLPVVTVCAVKNIVNIPDIPLLRVNTRVNPEAIMINNTTTMTVDITGRNIHGRSRMPLDMMLVMDSSGSMARYSNTIQSTYNGTTAYGHWVVLSQTSKRYATFTLTRQTSVGILLQVAGDNATSTDVFGVRLLNSSNNNEVMRWREDIAYVRWDNVPAGTYTIEAKLTNPNSNPNRILAIALPPIRINMAEDKAVGFINNLTDNIDRAGIISFGGNNRGRLNIKYVQNITESEIRDAIIPARGGTPLGDPIIEAITHFNDNPRANAIRAIVLFTDGWHNMGSSPEAAALQAKNAGIPIYVIGFGYVDEPRMINIANITGGKYFHARTGEDLAAIFDRLATTLTNVIAKNTSLRIELAPDVFYVNDSSRRSLSCNLGTISANETVSRSFEVRVNRGGQNVSINTINSVVEYDSGSVPVQIGKVDVYQPLEVISSNLINIPPDNTPIGKVEMIRGNATIHNPNWNNVTVDVILYVDGIEFASNNTNITASSDTLINISTPFIASRSGIHVVEMRMNSNAIEHTITLNNNHPLKNGTFTTVIPRVR